MALQEKLEKLQNDFSNLDMENIGGWPLPVKMVCWLVVMIGVIALSYQLILRDEQASLDREAQKEVSLRKEFEQKVQDAANLDAYRMQMKEMSESFSTLLGQLPKDTEVPGLLDDITEKGQNSGLNFDAIDLKQEKKADFYVELPISIKVNGGFHDFGSFVSGIAGLPRIVTLHDFLIQPSSSKSSGAPPASGGKGGASPSPQAKNEADRRNSEELTMSIMAKTYRYKSAEDTEKDQEKMDKEKPKAKAQPADKSAAKGKKGEGK